MSDVKSQKSAYALTMPEMEVQVKGLEKHIFYFGKGMQDKCMQSSKAFIDYVGRTYGESEKQSILANRLIITNMKEPKKIEKKDDYERMTYSEQVMWKKQMDVWVTVSQSIDNNLSKAYSVLWSLCHSGLQQTIKRDVDYQKMTEGDVKELYRIVIKICHGNNSTENPYTNMMEALYNFHMIQGDSFELLADYTEAFERKYDVLVSYGMLPNSPEFRDLYMKELEAKNMTTSDIYKKLRAWQLEEQWKASAEGDTPPQEDRRIAIQALMEQYKAYVYIKRAGRRHDSYRIELHNGYNNGMLMWPADVSAAQHKMDIFKVPSHVRNEENKESIKRQTHLQQDFNPVHDPAIAPGGEQGTSKQQPSNWIFRKGVHCFKCDREGHLTRECWFDTKADGSPLNSKQTIDKKYKEKFADRVERSKERNENKSSLASSHFINHNMTPSVEEFLDVEPAVDRPSQELTYQDELIARDEETKCMTYDIRSLSNHVYNQVGVHAAPTTVLFDSCSTCDIFVNKDFLQDIRDCNWTLKLQTQNSECDVTQIGDLPGVGTVWYYPQGTANILSIHRMIVNSGWSVDFNTKHFEASFKITDLAFRCTTSEGVRILFHPTRQGLYGKECAEYIQAGKETHVFGKEITDNGTHFGRAMCDGARLIPRKCHANEPIETLEESKKRFTKRDQARATLVRRFQHVAGHPSDATIIYSAATNAIKNSPITRRDVKLALDMLGRSEYAVQGKTTRTQPDPVAQRETIEVPTTIVNYYSNVELSIDVMHVNKIPFLVSISKNIHYGTVNALDNLKINTMEPVVKRIIQKYRHRGFNVILIHVDIQFKAMKDRENLEVAVNVVSRDEHVPEIERFIRVIKERTRCYYAMFPYKCLPRMMIIQLLITVVFYINAFVWTRGVSQYLPPVTLIEGVALDFNLHFHVIPGEYVHTYEGTTNDEKSRTVGAIALGPSGNLQGGIRCYSLLTGKILNRTLDDVTPLKMPMEAIRRLNYMARQQKSEQGLLFADRSGNIDRDATITGVTQDERLQQSTYTPAEHEYDIDHAAGPEAYAGYDGGDEDDIDVTGVPEDDNAPANDQEAPAPVIEEINNEQFVAPENREDEVQPPDDDNSSESESEAQETTITRTRSGRVSKPYDFENDFPDIYSESHVLMETENNFEDRIKSMDHDEYQLYKQTLQWYEHEPELCEAIVHKAKTMSIKQGIKKHGSEAKASAMKEVKNLVENDCFGETEYSKLSQEQKDKALPILMFMVMKRNGLLKTRGVADGSVQRLYTNKDDVSSPTPDFYAFKYICAMISREARDVASVDLPGFFLQTEQDGNEIILLKLTGEVALLLRECDPGKWEKHLNKENGQWVIYVVCKKAIYGTMNAALLAYKKLASLFEEWDMIPNPYDPCVWNKEVEGDQLTVIFHVDDLLISHKSPLIVTRLIGQLESKYGKRDKLTVTRGPVHEYLGMTVDFSNKGRCIFSQYDYIKKLLKIVPKSLNASYRATPAPEYLFKTDEDSPLLDRERAEEYHNIVAKILWISQRSRPDLQLATGFHCTRVKDPREHDWLKLGQLIGYLRKTRYLPLVIAINGSGATIYIDGAHAVHMDAKGHSGMVLSQGRGAMLSASKKLGVVTTSSTETEIVSTGERLPKCTWFRYFRIAQGEEEKEDVLMQDNKSAIVLQKNYPYSTRKGSKHIHVRYFFAVDKLKSKELKIVYCPTDELVADYNSKPLQGKLFETHRDTILGIRHDELEDYKTQYLAILKKYDLLDDDESDIMSN